MCRIGRWREHHHERDCEVCSIVSRILPFPTETAQLHAPIWLTNIPQTTPKPRAAPLPRARTFSWRDTGTPSLGGRSRGRRRGRGRLVPVRWRCPAPAEHPGSVPGLSQHLHEQGQEARRRPAGAASPPLPGEARRGPAAAPRHRRGQRQDVLSLPCTSQRALYITSAA